MKAGFALCGCWRVAAAGDAHQKAELLRASEEVRAEARGAARVIRHREKVSGGVCGRGVRSGGS